MENNQEEEGISSEEHAIAAIVAHCGDPTLETIVREFIVTLFKYILWKSGCGRLDGGFAGIGLQSIDGDCVTLRAEYGYQWNPDPIPEWDATYEISTHICRVPVRFIVDNKIDAMTKAERMYGLWKQIAYKCVKQSLTFIEDGVKDLKVETEEHKYIAPDGTSDGETDVLTPAALAALAGAEISQPQAQDSVPS